MKVSAPSVSTLIKSRWLMNQSGASKRGTSGAAWRVFHSFLGPEMVYVGFGEWNGVTAMIASHYTKLAIGLEPDPPAHLRMMDNFQFNQQLPLLGAEICISNETGELIMSGVGQSGSMLSTVKGYFHPHVWERKTVQCVPLYDFLEQLHTVFGSHSRIPAKKSTHGLSLGMRMWLP